MGKNKLKIFICETCACYLILEVENQADEDHLPVAGFAVGVVSRRISQVQ